MCATLSMYDKIIILLLSVCPIAAKTNHSLGSMEMHRQLIPHVHATAQEHYYENDNVHLWTLDLAISILTMVLRLLCML